MKNMSDCYGLLYFLGTLPQLHISYKPQKISPKSQGLVRQLLHEKIRDAYIHPQVRMSFLRNKYARFKFGSKLHFEPI